MAKRTNQTSYRIGDLQVEAFPTFLYEITSYKISKDYIELQECKYIQSKERLKDDSKVIVKRYNGYIIQIAINLIGVPESFIKSNNLSLYELIKKKKK